MFFREKESGNTKTPVLQLVESKRVGDSVRQQIVISLGTGFDVPESLRVEVARAVEQKLAKNEPLIFDLKVADLAERIAKKIQTAGLWKGRSDSIPARASGQIVPDVAEVLVDKVEHGQSRKLGPVLIGHHFWQKLGIPEILAGCDFNGVQRQAAEISVLNRLIAPGSENALPAWIRTTAVADLIAKNAEEFAADRFYRISDRLLRHQEAIETALYDRERSLFSLEGSIYLYDLTNSYFEGTATGNPKAEYNGNQKEKRTDCPQVVVALALDGAGFVRRHWTFKGKLSDSKSLPEILEKLKADMSRATLPTVIMDRGVATDDNVKLLKDAGLHYIVVGRSGDEKAFLEEFTNAKFEELTTASGQVVQIRLERREGETSLLCKSDGRKVKETAMRNHAEKKLEAELKALQKSVESGQRKDPTVIEQQIGRIRERHSRAAHYYEIAFRPFVFDFGVTAGTEIPKALRQTLEKLKSQVADGKIGRHQVEKKLAKLKEKEKYAAIWPAVTISQTAPALTWQPVDEKRAGLTTLDGCYLLRTDRQDLDDRAIWRTYTQLTRLEAAFRHLKSDLGLRPNFHQYERRVDGHIFISILAYHLLHAIETTLRNQDEHHSWATIRRVVSNHTYATIELPTPHETVIHVRKAGRPEPLHQEIYQKLGVDFERLPVTKMVVEN